MDTEWLSLAVYVQVKTKTFGQRRFSYHAPKQWNSLPSDIHHIQSSQAFKTKLTSTKNVITSDFKFCRLTCLPPPYPPSLHVTFLLCVCVCVCVCEREREREEYNIMTMSLLFLRLNVYIWEEGGC